MKSRYIGDLSHVEHLLVVEGDADKVAAFVKQAQRNSVALSLEALMPPPAALSAVDELMLAHFHLVFGDQAEARNIYSEIDEEWPLPDVDANSQALRDLLRNDPGIIQNARAVQKNVQAYGVLNADAWRRARWGSGADLREVEFEEVSDERVQYRFNSPVSRNLALLDISGTHPELSIGAIVTNFRERKQYWFYRFSESQDLRSTERRFPEGEDLVELFIDNPPELFAYAG